MLRHPVVVCLAACLGQAAFAADLDGETIRDQVVGRSLDWWDADGWYAGALEFAPDGRAFITVDTPVPSSDTGRWTLSGDRLCTRWSTARDGREKCYRLARDADGNFVSSGGNVFRPREAGV